MKNISIETLCKFHENNYLAGHYYDGKIVGLSKERLGAEDAFLVMAHPDEAQFTEETVTLVVAEDRSIMFYRHNVNDDATFEDQWTILRKPKLIKKMMKAYEAHRKNPEEFQKWMSMHHQVHLRSLKAREDLINSIVQCAHKIEVALDAIDRAEFNTKHEDKLRDMHGYAAFGNNSTLAGIGNKKLHKMLRKLGKAERKADKVLKKINKPKLVKVTRKDMMATIEKSGLLEERGLSKKKAMKLGHHQFNDLYMDAKRRKQEAAEVAPKSDPIFLQRLVGVLDNVGIDGTVFHNDEPDNQHYDVAQYIYEWTESAEFYRVLDLLHAIARKETIGDVAMVANKFIEGES